MKQANSYTTLKREVFSLTDFDVEERAIVDALIDLQKRETNWANFRNVWISKVSDLYTNRGLSRDQIVKKPLWRIAQDLAGRILVALGHARLHDYRDGLEKLIRTEFPNRRAFCEATGISEDMLSHVLAHRKHLAMDTLTDALRQIGYELHISPTSATNSVG